MQERKKNILIGWWAKIVWIPLLSSCIDLEVPEHQALLVPKPPLLYVLHAAPLARSDKILCKYHSQVPGMVQDTCPFLNEHCLGETLQKEKLLHQRKKNSNSMQHWLGEHLWNSRGGLVRRRHVPEHESWRRTNMGVLGPQSQIYKEATRRNMTPWVLYY